MRTRTAIKLIVLGAILLAVGVGVELIERRIAPERLRRELEARLGEALDGEVSIGAARLELPRAVVHVSQVAVTLPGEEDPVFECPRVTAALDRGALLRGKVVPTRIALSGAAVRLSYDPDARRWNVAELLAEREEAVAGAPRNGKPAGLLRDGLRVEGATLSLQHPKLLGDGAPRRYTGLWFNVRPEAGGAGGWRLEGGLECGLLAGTWFTGRASRGGPDPRYLLRFGAEGLHGGEELWRLVPMGHKVWSDFRPAGRFAVKGTVQPDAGGRVRWGLDVEVSEATATTRFFPAEAHSVSGLVRVTDAGLTVRDVTGVIASDEFEDAGPQTLPAHVRVDGVSRWGRRGGSYTIGARDVPLCRTSVEAIPERGGELWERLRPRGRANLVIIVEEMPETGRARFRAEADLEETTLAPPELPVALERVHGAIEVEQRTVRFRALEGLLGTAGAGAQPAFALGGTLDLDGRDSRLSLELRGVRTDEALVRAIPTLGDDLWEHFRPEVMLDAEVVVVDRPDSEAMDYAADVHLRGGRAAASFLPMPLSDITGRLRVEGSRIFVEQFTAAVDTAGEETADGRTRNRVDLRGKVDLESSRADLDVLARDLTLTQALLRAVPEVGEQILAEMAASGMVSLSGRIHYDGRAEPPLHYLLDIGLKDVTVQPKLAPMPLEALSGDLLATEYRVLSSNLTGVSCGGQLRGSIVAHYGGGGLPSFGATVHFDQISLADLARRLAGEQKKVAGRLSGTVNLGGIVGEPASMNGDGRLTLVEGQLWETTFFGRLISILHLSIPSERSVPATGEALFDLRGPEARVREFSLTGGGLSLSGFGTVWLDDATLDLKMVAVGSPEGGPAIPLIGSLIGAVLQAVEKELVRLDVTGPVEDPVFEHKVLSTLTSPITGLRSILFSPLFGGESPPRREQ